DLAPGGPDAWQYGLKFSFIHTCFFLFFVLLLLFIEIFLHAMLIRSNCESKVLPLFVCIFIERNHHQYDDETEWQRRDDGSGLQRLKPGLPACQEQDIGDG